MIQWESPWLNPGDTLICFGDSLTGAADNYVDRLEAKLGPLGIRVIKSGRGGDKTPWALTRLQRDVIDVKPTAVSIMLGTNDCQIGLGKWGDEPPIPLEVYRWNLVWMMHLCKLAGIAKFSITPPLGYEYPLLAEVGPVFVPYQLAARQAAATMQARVVPADMAFAQVWAQSRDPLALQLTRDGGHLNARGEDLLAQTCLSAWGWPT
jgi:lysophospholipase L1-like esterase